MTIREASAGEEKDLIALYESLFERPGYEPPGWDPGAAAQRLAAAIESPGSLVLVAEDDSTPAGLLCAYLDIASVRYGQRCWIEDLVVDSERRSRGIGARLIDTARDWAREQGATHIELDTGLARTDAQRFYDRLGDPRKGFSYSWPL